jgi:hypothetical protein
MNSTESNVKMIEENVLSLVCVSEVLVNTVSANCFLSYCDHHDDCGVMNKQDSVSCAGCIFSGLYQDAAGTHGTTVLFTSVMLSRFFASIHTNKLETFLNLTAPNLNA